MFLATMPKLKGKQRPAKRSGRGMGSGKGSHTTGRGQKGQKSRSGFNLPVGFEGGQVPLFKKMPKLKGFVNSHRSKGFVVNVRDLEVFKAGEKVTPKDLIGKNIMKKIPAGKVKVLGNGELSKALTLEGFAYSKSAVEKITKAGGKAQ